MLKGLWQLFSVPKHRRAGFLISWDVMCKLHYSTKHVQRDVDFIIKNRKKIQYWFLIFCTHTRLEPSSYYFLWLSLLLLRLFYNLTWWNCYSVIWNIFYHIENIKNDKRRFSWEVPSLNIFFFLIYKYTWRYIPALKVSS